MAGAYPQASWVDLIVNSFHMTVLERVYQPGDGLLPAILTMLLPLCTIAIVGEGVLRVLTAFLSRSEHREEWDLMVAKSYSNHIVVCGVGELGKALIKRIHTDQPRARIVLVDLHPGMQTELGFSGENLICIQSDMTGMETLKKASCFKARLILLAAGNDSFNLEAAYKILQLNPKAEIWGRLHHIGLAEMMDLSRRPNLHFFNPYQQAAETIISHLLHEEKVDKS